MSVYIRKSLYVCVYLFILSVDNEEYIILGFVNNIGDFCFGLVLKKKCNLYIMGLFL